MSAHLFHVYSIVIGLILDVSFLNVANLISQYAILISADSHTHIHSTLRITAEKWSNRNAGRNKPFVCAFLFSSSSSSQFPINDYIVSHRLKSVLSFVCVHYNQSIGSFKFFSKRNRKNIIKMEFCTIYFFRIRYRQHKERV